MKATVIGSGSWGSGFARLLVRRGHDVQVLAVTREEAAQLQATHENPHFLPGVHLPDEIRFLGMEDADLRSSGLLVYAVPTQAVREVAAAGARPSERRARCNSRWPRATRSARSSVRPR
jgi:glycerol-3-phosphate dehydrogenase (NAD(P)+)